MILPTVEGIITRTEISDARNSILGDLATATYDVANILDRSNPIGGGARYAHAIYQAEDLSLELEQ